MDEPRDPAVDPGSSRTPVAAAVKLSPIQQAWGRYVAHATRCDICRNVDRGRCETADLLYSLYRDLVDLAYRQLDGEAG